MDWKFENPPKDGKYYCIVKIGNVYRYKLVSFTMNGKSISHLLPARPCWYRKYYGVWDNLCYSVYKTDYELENLDSKDDIIICWHKLVLPEKLKEKLKVSKI